MCELHDQDCELHEEELPAEGTGLLSGGFDRRLLLRGAGIAAVGLGAAGAGVLPAMAAVSQNGWGGITSSGSSALNRGFSAHGVTFPGGVRTGQVGTVLGYVARRFHERVEPLRSGWCWGWAYRPIRGGTTLSNHSSATAIDCNAPEHPLGVSGTFSSSQRSQIAAILNACEGTVRWGGNYSGRKDEMHFEINVRPGSAKLARVAAKLGGSNPPPPPPPPSSGWPTLKKGSTGYRVTVLQYLLRAHGRSVAVDGVFGQQTHDAVRSFQGSKNLLRDGIAGPKTWGKIIITTKKGSRGNAVRATQRALNAHGKRLVVDGDFGTKTHDAVRSFQGSKNLLRDGIVGPKTWAALV
ncbi:peptidoglycan-binding protein [Microlunatus sp. Y2014]|uniref:peptidoglycan-binding protein n=1 Tax=Microlunatus sp. Y2014 TaxID=3418488 RepID=UPI003DA726C6